MMIVVAVWLLLALFEGLAYARLALHGSLRRPLMVVLSILLLASLVLALIQNWHVWGVACLFGIYRLVNVARFYAGRLPEQQLRSASLRAHSWLIAIQIVASTLAAYIAHFQFQSWLLGSIAGLQFAATLVLMRASLHTWRHAELFRRVQAHNDADLPSVSVLIPARNETAALDVCLRQLVACDYPKLEIIVFDDNSANPRTPEIIRSFAHDGVRFVQGDAPDEKNWLAKNHAYERLSQEASGDVLVFCGVDALFGRQTLRRLVETLESRQKDMLSVLPLKASSVAGSISLLQPMRYYWELCLPRRFFKRPPVLSTCWLIRKEALEREGGFDAVARSITPEAYFARQAVVTDAYSFIRSNSELDFYSAKPNTEQYDTSLRMRYPQLHRRLELVAMAAALELTVFLGPFIGVSLVGFTHWHMAYLLLWVVSIACLLVTYYLVAVATRLNNALTAWVLMPFAFAADIIMLHISLYKYEFSTVEWKGRDVAVPVMQVIPRLPKIS